MLKSMCTLWYAFFLVSLALGTGTSARASPTAIHNVVVTKTIAGETTVDTQGRLPYHWDALNGDVDGQARFVATVSVDDLSKPMAIYIPRIGNTFVVKVNGRELESFGTLPPNAFDDAATKPYLFLVPADWLSQPTAIDITIGVLGGRRGGLDAVTVGLPGEVKPLYEWEYLLEVNARTVLVVVTVVLGILALLLAIRQREVTYLYYALAEICWAIVTARLMNTSSPLPWPIWQLCYEAAFVLAIPLQCKFCLIVVDRDRGWPRWFTTALLILGLPLIVLHGVFGEKWIVQMAIALWLLNSVVMASQVLIGTWNSSRLEHTVLKVAVLVVVASAIRDAAHHALTNLYHLTSFTRFAWTGFGITFAWVITERMRHASSALASMNETLSRQLAIRSNELAEIHARVRASDVEQGALLERQRLTRDLHDGLGGHLVGVLRMAKLPTATKEDITKQLHLAVDQLKITVDALQETDGDIPSLLGAVRYRLSRRLDAAGIDLVWNVDHLPPMENWGVRQSYELQMILFEVFTNMIVHSGANQAVLVARPLPGMGKAMIEIDIADNGKGFDSDHAAGTGGRGLANMKARADTLGAKLSISSRTGETKVSILLTCPTH